jgi:hypothetical protein
LSSPALGSNVKIIRTNAYRNSVTYSKNKMNRLEVGWWVQIAKIKVYSYRTVTGRVD